MSTADWATRTARHIRGMFQDEGFVGLDSPFVTEDKIASIIAAHAEPLVALLRESCSVSKVMNSSMHEETNLLLRLLIRVTIAAFRYKIGYAGCVSFNKELDEIPHYRSDAE
jgi:hypothetical protein